MRIISIILNIISFFIIVTLFIDNGWPRKIQKQLFLVCFLVTPIVSSITLWDLKIRGSESWLSLYFQRKKLEEKMRLEKLKNDQ